MKKWIILLCLLTGSIAAPAFAQANDAKQALLKVLHTAGHDTLRLNTLQKLIKVTSAQPEVRGYYVNELLKEADLQNNDTFRCYAYLYQVYMHYNNSNLAGVNEWLKKIEPLAEKIERYDLLFRAQQCAIDLQISNGEYEQGERSGQRILKEASQLKSKEGIIVGYQCLAGAYQSTYQYLKAADALEKAYALAKESGNYEIELEIGSLLLNLYQTLQDNPNWLKCLKQKEQKVKEVIRKHPQLEESLRSELLATYVYYMAYYRLTDQPEMAAKYKKLADEYYSNEYYYSQLLYHKERSSYYCYTREWEKAAEELDHILPFLKELAYTEYCTALSNKAKILARQNKYKQSVQLHKEVLYGKDSLQVAIYNKQIEQLKQSYDANQAILERASIHRYMQYSILSLVVIVIGILTWFALHNLRISKRLAKSEKEMRLIAEEVAQANKTKERFLSNMSYAIRVPLKSVVSHSMLLASDKEISAEERNEASEIISKTSAELMKLINDILDLSRLEAGMMKFRVGNIDMNAYLHDAVAIAGTRYAIKSDFTQTENKALTAETDGSRFLDIMVSLLIPEKADKQLSVTSGKIEEENVLQITVSHPLLATTNQTQETIIRNEINRMLIERFGGEYTVKPGYVRFTIKTLPL